MFEWESGVKSSVYKLNIMAVCWRLSGMAFNEQYQEVLIIPFSLRVGAKPWYVKSHQERMNIQATSERSLSVILFCS